MMTAKNFDLPQYLKRIAYKGLPLVNIETLKQLMQNQLRQIPFENIDVQQGKIVSFTPEDIVEKIVINSRGGYCYEVNGLFAMALTSIGFTYQFVAARPMFYPVRRPKTHMAIIVNIGDEQWLCDLGFGSYGIREPLLMSKVDKEIAQDFDSFMLSKIDERNFLLQAKVEGQWKSQYSFDLYQQEWIDFMPVNYLNSTHPDSVFVQKPLIILFDKAGRKVLFGNTLKIIKEESIQNIDVHAGNYKFLLSNHFQINLAENLPYFNHCRTT